MYETINIHEKQAADIMFDILEERNLVSPKELMLCEWEAKDIVESYSIEWANEEDKVKITKHLVNITQ
jgi:hypothetical protein